MRVEQGNNGLDDDCGPMQHLKSIIHGKLGDGKLLFSELGVLKRIWRGKTRCMRNQCW